MIYWYNCEVKFHAEQLAECRDGELIQRYAHSNLLANIVRATRATIPTETP